NPLICSCPLLTWSCDWWIGSSTQSVLKPVFAQRADTTAESTPPLIPTTKPFIFAFAAYSFNQFTIWSITCLVCIFIGQFEPEIISLLTNITLQAIFRK